ncbi:MAG: lamin tail domain-containing protein [Bacteroidales bacterium]|nr:lamin tail domain-containing protein [Bacteroidales bacterium]
MNIQKLGLLLCLAATFGLCACGERESNTKLVLNEVLVTNESNFQDDYGCHSGWIEIFNKSYTSADLAGWLIKASCTPGDTATYFIPKGDIQTNIRPRQHALFWADGAPRRGTFHTNFTLQGEQSTWIGLFDSGNRLMDQMTLPGGVLKADQSYARVSDAATEWEVKGGSADSYVTPSTNNKTIDGNPKKDKFSQHDPAGIGMAISAMSVVFLGLLLLFACFYFIGRASIRTRSKNKVKLKEEHAAQAAAAAFVPDEVAAAIALALHEELGTGHDADPRILTIRHNPGSAWSGKEQNLRQVPQRK